jgi:hypothetical protein
MCHPGSMVYNMMHHPLVLLTLIICQTLLPQILHPQATQAQHNPPQDALIDVLLGPARTPFTINELSNISRQWIRPTQENYAGAPVLQSRSGTKPAARAGWSASFSAKKTTLSEETWQKLPTKAGVSWYSTGTKTTKISMEPTATTNKTLTKVNTKRTKPSTCNTMNPRQQEHRKEQITAQPFLLYYSALSPMTMTIAANTVNPKPAATRSKSARKSLKASNKLLMQVEKRGNYGTKRRRNTHKRKGRKRNKRRPLQNGREPGTPTSSHQSPQRPLRTSPTPT